MALFTKKKTTSEAAAQTPLHQHQATLIRQPHITEKSLRLTQHDQYVFVVDSRATKQEVKKQIHALYNVDVIGARSLTKEGTKTWRGVASGKERFKKMIITVKKGQKIDMTANA